MTSSGTRSRNAARPATMSRPWRSATRRPAQPTHLPSTACSPSCRGLGRGSTGPTTSHPTCPGSSRRSRRPKRQTRRPRPSWMPTRCRTGSWAAGSDGSPGAISASRSNGATIGRAPTSATTSSAPTPGPFETTSPFSTRCRPASTSARTGRRPRAVASTVRRAMTTSTTRSWASTSLSATGRRSGPTTSPPHGSPTSRTSRSTRQSGRSIATCSRGSRPVRRRRYAIHTASGSARSSGAMPSGGRSLGDRVRRPCWRSRTHPCPTPPTASTARCGRRRSWPARSPRRDARSAIEASLSHIPPRSRLAECLRDVLDIEARGADWDEAIEAIQRRYGHYSWVHTINNAALIAAGLLWGRGDYAATVGLTVSGGWDTDSNGATAGSVAGVLLGASSLPGHFVEPLHDRVRSALFGFDDSRISDLAARTTRIALHGLSDGVAGGALVGVDPAVG